jgi:hypothetical protein
MDFVLVVLVGVIAALLWRLISAVERIEDEIIAARREPASDPHPGDAEGI